MRLLKIVTVGLICVAGARGQTGVEQRRYETVFYPSGKLKIEAYVYKPGGAGPFPVVIYNHGSRVERDREEMPFVYVGSMLKRADMWWWVPERRGYGSRTGRRLARRWGRTAVHDS